LRNRAADHTLKDGVNVAVNNLAGLFWPNDSGEMHDLEDTEDCRSAGGHGNQHVRLRGAQVRLVKRSARLDRHSPRAVADVPLESLKKSET
jgi:hypothetical protein